MKITYESITKKLGFDPMNPPEPEYHGHEDDSIPNPYAPLTLEEHKFLEPYLEETLRKRREQRGLKPTQAKQ